jgi:hypothetical protein
VTPHALHPLRQRGALPLRVSLGAAALAACVALGWHLGAGRVQARWDAADLAKARAAERQAAEQRAAAARASLRAVEAAQQIQQRTPQARRDVASALRAPVVCKTDPPDRPRIDDLALGDIRVPPAVVDGLRRAGADPAPNP